MKQSTMNRTLIGIDPAASVVNPATGQLFYDKTIQILMVFDGMTWKPIDMSEPIWYCIQCHKSDWSHNDIKLGDPFPDHPFMRNNLELLEWKDKERMKQL